MRFFVLIVGSLFFVSTLRADTITVSAAVSLKESLQKISELYESKTHEHVTFNFDASGKLAAQIKQGAPVDLFISADDEQMDKLVEEKKIEVSSRRIVVENTLVLIAAAGAKNPPAKFADLKDSHGRKIAIGEPKSVPAGRYAMQTLKAMKLDDAVTPRLVYGESVRQVLTYVEQDEVFAGIVYGTDALQAGDKVKVVATADGVTHDKIEYPGAVVADSAHAGAARKFLEFFESPQAKKVFQDKGFIIPESPAPDAAPARPAK